MRLPMSGLQEDSVRDGDTLLVESVQGQAVRPESVFGALLSGMRQHLLSEDLPLLLQQRSSIHLEMLSSSKG